jgi:hypothetical protein
MALNPDFLIAIDPEGETATITDQTIYGGANPLRSALYVYIAAYKVAETNSDVQIALTSNTNDPLTASAWSWEYEVDGWFRFLYAAIPGYNIGTTYDIYNAVADSTTKLVYRSRSAGNVGHALTDSTYWEPISNPASLANNIDQSNESLNITSAIYQRVLTWNSQTAYSDLTSENCACTDCDDDKIIPPYNLFSLLLNGAIVADEREEYVKGEVICRKMESQFGC